jgi:formamidopyrimidine-DNA glycosylase
MPELPDVELFGRYFSHHCLGRKIQAVELRSETILRDRSKKEIEVALKGKKFLSVKRLGKYLFVEVQSSLFLVLHFGMTGFLHAFKGKNPYDMHTRALFHFVDHTHLAFVDMRLLGLITLTHSIEAFAQQLGPDALLISQPAFRLLFKKGSVKSVLMDQKKIAGVGNIYCDEILFFAGLSPHKEAASLTEKEINKLYGSMKHVLKKAIEANVESTRMPATWLIHARQKQTLCPKCKAPIDHIKIGGRSTYFCPNCQRA